MDERLDEFERAWLSNSHPPAIAEFLPPEGHAERSSVLHELIKIDLDLRWRNADPCADQSSSTRHSQGHKLEDYLQSFPELGSIDDISTDLVLHEFRIRRWVGDSPSLEEYRKRFPRHAEEITQTLSNFDDTKIQTGEEETTRQNQYSLNAAVSTIVPGQSFGDYELISEIARGGMGVVFKARQRNADRVVALKMILQGEFADQELIQRFRTEAKAAAKLSHPGIVPVYDVGEIQGQQFFSMGFVDGESLKEKVADDPLPPREAADLVRQIADAVAYAHLQDIVHRDLKPANILIGADGQPLVTDFGLAKQLDADGELTASGQIMGTPHYMPPEQAAGRIDELGPSADIYSLGAVLYFLIVGKPPFQAANTMELLRQVCEREAVPPRQLNPSIDRDLETICLKCLEKSPDRRYASADDLCNDLTRYLQNRPIIARPVGRLNRTARWCRRNPIVAGLLAAVLLTLLGGIGFSSFFALEAAQRADEANDEKSRAFGLLAKNRKLLDEKEQALGQKEKALGEKQKALEKAEWQLYVRNIQTAHREWYANNVTLAVKALNSCPKELRGWEYRYLENLFTRDYSIHSLNPSTVYDFSFHPNGKLVAIAAGKLSIRDASNGHVIHRSSEQFGVRAVGFRKDGLRLASADWDGRLIVWDTSTWKPIQKLRGLRRTVSVAYSPHQDQVVCASQTQVRVIDLKSGRSSETTDVRGQTNAIGAVAYHPVENRLVYSSPKGTFSVDAAECRFDKATRIGPSAKSITITPNGKQILLAGWNSMILLDGSTYKVIRTLTVSENERFLAASLSDDGKRIVTGSWDGIVNEWSVARGRVVSTLRGHLRKVWSVGFSADGRFIVSGGSDGRVLYWKKPTYPLNGLRVRAFDTDSTGRRIAAAMNSSQVWVFSGRGRWVGRVTLKSDADSNTFACDRSGKVIAYSNFGPLYIQEIPSGRHRCSIQPTSQSDYFTAVAFGPNGRVVATSSFRDKTVKIRNSETGKRIQTLHGHQGFSTALAFSPDGKTLCSLGYDGDLRIWNVATGVLKHTLRFGAGPGELAFSADGKTLATGDASGVIGLWNPATGRRVARWKGHADTIRSLCFSPDQKRIVTGGDDKTVRIWDTATRDNVLTLPRLKTSVFKVAFLDEGHSLLAESDTLHFWSTVSPKRAKIPHDFKRPSSTRDGRWKDAEEDVARYLQRRPDDADLVFRMAALLARHDRKRYRSHCAKLLARFGDTKQPEVAERTAKACLILAPAQEVLPAARRLAERAVSLNPRHWVMPWAECVRALAAYRTRDFAGAENWAKKCLSGPQTSDVWYRTVQATFVLAMAQARLGQAAAARRSFDDATRRLTARSAMFRTTGFDENWHDWLIADLLSREAKRVLGPRD